jgi:hypothetical protein
MAEDTAQRLQRASVGQRLLSRKISQFLKLRRRLQVRSGFRLARRRGAVLLLLVRRTAVGLRHTSATEGGIDLGCQRDCAVRFQAGESQPQRMSAGRLSQELRQRRGGRQLSGGQDHGIG